MEMAMDVKTLAQGVLAICLSNPCNLILFVLKYGKGGIVKLKLLPSWHKTKEIYSLTNDQGMKNMDNLLSPSGKVVSLFLINEQPKVGLHMFDRMIRDYKLTTENLHLLLAGKLKIKECLIPIYIIREKISKKAIVNMFFEKDEKLFAFIFALEKFERSIVKNVKENPVLLESLKLLEENL